MPETLIINPTEQRLMTDDVPAAEIVFNGVYGAFADEAKNSPAKLNKSIDGQEQIVTVDPAFKFVQDRFDRAKETVEPIASQPMRPTDISDRFINEVVAEAKEVYDGKPLAVSARVEKAKRVVSGFIDRASEMFNSGEADGLTVKLFFESIQGLKGGLSMGYNSLVKKTDEPMPDEETKHSYVSVVNSLFVNKPDVQEQESGGFLHVNGERYLASGSSTNERYYISPKLNGRPEEVIKTWTETLQSLGLEDKLYYKVATHLSRRYEQLVAYASPETATDMERAVQEFARRCQTELLSDTVIPTGVEVSKGVAKAPEPNELNTLLRYRGKETISYNEFACAITELSLRRASYDFMKQGIPAEQVTPKALSEAARPFFVQFVKLSGIDPATMRTL